MDPWPEGIWTVNYFNPKSRQRPGFTKFTISRSALCYTGMFSQLVLTFLWSWYSFSGSLSAFRRHYPSGSKLNQWSLAYNVSVTSRNTNQLQFRTCSYVVAGKCIILAFFLVWYPHEYWKISNVWDAETVLQPASYIISSLQIVIWFAMHCKSLKIWYLDKNIAAALSSCREVISIP